MDENKIAEKIAKHDVEIENIKEDVCELKDTQKMIYEMNGNIKLLVEKIGTTNAEICGIKKDIGDLRSDMDEVKNKDSKKDAKKWDKAVWLVIAALIGYALTKSFGI